MVDLDYCPFCIGGKASVVWEEAETIKTVYVRCDHCLARGQHYSDLCTIHGEWTEDPHDLENKAVQDWNQKELRALTLCDNIKYFFGQLRYDIEQFYERMKER